ncbi:MAG: hypothetical protein KJ983_02355, partial [Candidatus Omnitrophica bacterium]|nr:hypothetical protein [Candidatus Omnitrophota bacterium]
PSAYYLDPLWQKLLPLKGKTVTLKGNITEISPFSGYDGYLENVSIVAEDSEIENAEVTVSKAYIYSKVERDAKNITVAFYQFTLHTSPITIDRKTGIISYNLPKGSSLKTILTPQGEIRYERNGVPIPGDNKKDLNQYRTELEKMIRWADKILKMKTDKPLSEQDRDFIESVIKELIQIGSRVKNRTKSEALDKLGNVVPIEKLQPQIGSTLSVQYLLQQSI